MFNLFIAVNIHCLEMATYLMGGLKETRQTDGVDGEESEDICENNKIPEL